MSQEPRLTLLKPGDEARLERFLRLHSDSSMFLRSNLAQAGLVYGGRTAEGEYLAIEGEDGELTGVAAHYWNEMIALQAPGQAGRLAARLAAHTRREVGGLVGPHEQVTGAREALGLAAADLALDSHEYLYALDLHELKLPRLLKEGTWKVVRPDDLQRAVVAEHRDAFQVEALRLKSRPGSLTAARAEVDEQAKRGRCFALLDGEQVVASCAFNAALEDAVQVGAVFVPWALRGRGYGRAVTAGALQLAKEAGVARGVLFTADENRQAQRAYEALGFKRVGSYGLLLVR